MSELTARQEERISEFLVDLVRWGAESPRRHELIIGKSPEVRPGRGHDIDVIYLGEQVVAWLLIDPYGHGHEGWGHSGWVHNSGDDDCTCEECAKDSDEKEEADD